jgi:hypothetical protein
MSYKHCLPLERKFVYLQLADHADTLTDAAPAYHIVGRTFQLVTHVQKYLHKAVSCNLHPRVVSSYIINTFRPSTLFSEFGSKQNSRSNTIHNVPIIQLKQNIRVMCSPNITVLNKLLRCEILP